LTLIMTAQVLAASSGGFLQFASLSQRLLQGALMTKAVPLSMLVWAALASNATAMLAYSDVPDNHWAYDAIQFAAVDHAFMLPAFDGLFHGDAPFTRFQMGVAVRRLLTELEGQTRTSWASPGVGGYTFTDLPNNPEMRAAVLDVANTYHIFEGLPGVTGQVLGADKVVTRYEMAKVIDRLVRLGESKGVIDPSVLQPRPRNFSDLPTTAWDYTEVKDVAERYQVMVGFPDGTFRGPEELTRYQFAATARQTFPLVHTLVQKTIELRATPKPTPVPTPTPTPTPEPLHRFSEDQQFHIAGGYRLLGGSGPYGSARWIGYGGPVFGLARLRAAYPLTDGTLTYDGDLNLGYAWAITPTFALQPFVGGKGYYTGTAALAGADYGTILSWNPGPFSMWLGGTGVSGLYGTAGSPLGMFLYDANVGIGWSFWQHVALTLEGNYGTLPTGPGAAAAGATANFGQDTGAGAELGLSFGF
jgi:hypothetical protein